MHSPAALTSFRRVLTADLSDVSSNDDAKPGSAGSSPSVQREDSALASRPHPLPRSPRPLPWQAPLLAPTGEIGGACSPRPIVRRRGACRGVERRGTAISSPSARSWTPTAQASAPRDGARDGDRPSRSRARNVGSHVAAAAVVGRSLLPKTSLTRCDETPLNGASRSLRSRSARSAYLVGYSEPAPFHRAFKRWTGLTPLAYRERVRERRCKFASP